LPLEEIQAHAHGKPQPGVARQTRLSGQSVRKPTSGPRRYQRGGQYVMPTMPGRGYTFDRIAETIDRFTEVVGFDRYAVYVFDYGAPTGLRLAVKHPDGVYHPAVTSSSPAWMARQQPPPKHGSSGPSSVLI
jgi:pimeloyl-ACP methyl ester carboxylesterase